MASRVFERSDLVSINHLRFVSGAMNSPYEGVVVSGFWDPRIPIFVDRREDIERGENARDSETQHPDCQMTSRANPFASEV